MNRICKYSYNRAKETFTFTYLSLDYSYTEYRFHTEQVDADIIGVTLVMTADEIMHDDDAIVLHVV